MKHERVTEEDYQKILIQKKKKSEYQKRYTAKNWENNPKLRLLRTSKLNSEQKQIEHRITEEDIIIPKRCPYLGIPLTATIGEGRVQSNASIDRISSRLGYVPGNIQVISDLANRMKNNATTAQLIQFAIGALKLHAPELLK